MMDHSQNNTEHSGLWSLVLLLLINLARRREIRAPEAHRRLCSKWPVADPVLRSPRCLQPGFEADLLTGPFEFGVLMLRECSFGFGLSDLFALFAFDANPAWKALGFIIASSILLGQNAQSTLLCR